MVPRFEKSSRKDAVLRSAAGDEVAIEWEWEGVTGNELKKLKSHKVWGREGYDHASLRYAVFITYDGQNNVEETTRNVKQFWKGASWPLLFILIASKETKRLSSKREFTSLRIQGIDGNGESQLVREVPAMPWNVDCTRWQYQMRKENSQ